MEMPTKDNTELLDASEFVLKLFDRNKDEILAEFVRLFELNPELFQFRSELNRGLKTEWLKRFLLAEMALAGLVPEGYVLGPVTYLYVIKRLMVHIEQSGLVIPTLIGENEE